LIRLEADEIYGRSRRVLLTQAGRSVRETAAAAALPLLESIAEANPAADAAALLSRLTQVRAWLDQKRSR
jgi:DNA-binding MarR family transcriptional regulator